MNDKFSKYLTGFCKSHNTQHALLNVIENGKSNLNKGNRCYIYGLVQGFRHFGPLSFNSQT